MSVETHNSFILQDKFDSTKHYETQKTMSLPSTPLTPLSLEAYAIKDVTEEHSAAILDHLRKFFFRDEPLNTAVNLIESENGTCVELENYSIESIKDDMSLMAVTNSGKIVGVCINGTIKRDAKHKGVGDCTNEKFSKILKFLEILDTRADVFGQFPDVNKILTVKILSVDGEWRGKGIAKELMDKTRNMARDRDYDLMRVDCSSYYSARAIARLGFDCIYSLKYEDLKENGKPFILPSEPHLESKIYVQRITKVS